MAIQFSCKNPKRLELVHKHLTLNGIRFAEILDSEAPPALRQRTLLVYCDKPLPALTALNVVLSGGVRVTPLVVDWAFPVPAIPAANLTPAETPYFTAIAKPQRVLAIRFHQPGDFSWYTLQLRTGPVSNDPPPNFDGPLSEIQFQFKAECPSDLDCATTAACPPSDYPAPALDYLSKDYASFRRLMLDRLSVTLPGWTEQSPADIGMAAVEVLAHAADHLSYYQDAAATEAYLGTARQRTSVARHARLLDYPMHHGQNARTWVFLEAATPHTLVSAGLQMFTRIDAGQPLIPPNSAQYTVALRQSPTVFETMHAQWVYPSHNSISLYTWTDEQCCLPQGATQATLKDDTTSAPNKRLRLRRGDVLVFEEVLGPETGLGADADPARRHAVRLTSVDPEATLNAAATQLVPAAAKTDPLTGQAIVNIAWAPEDALPFPMCLSAVVDRVLQPDITIVHGNIALADHGRTVTGETLEPLLAPLDGTYRPYLDQSPVTRTVGYNHQQALQASAAAALVQQPSDALAAITLAENDDTWIVEPDLLSSSRFTRAFVAEPNSEGDTFLRFGDGTFGMAPTPGIKLLPTYRTGNGEAGNIGRDAIAHVVTALAGVATARNPMPAVGGTEPEDPNLVKLYAPQAFRTQQRAITEQDYADRAGAHPDVQKAMATFRWTGSWQTVFITVDRMGGRPVDDAFRADMENWLESWRMAGVDLEVDGPRYVPLEIVMTVCVKPGYFRDNVQEALLNGFVFGAPGQKAFFDPDNLTFGQAIYLSKVVSTIMSVPGVAWVDVDDTPPKPNVFKRWGEKSRGELAAGQIDMQRLEIARVANDPNAAESGRIQFVMQGGI
jgi:hypothetical protein